MQWMLFFCSWDTHFREAVPRAVLTRPEDARVTLVRIANMLIGFSSMYLLEGK